MRLTVLISLLLIVSCNGDSNSKFTGGNNFNRPNVNKDNFKELSETEQSLLMSIGKVNNQGSREMGSSFYIGKVNGDHLFITNNHVFPESKDCKETTVTMAKTDLSPKILQCKNVLKTVSFKEGSDLTLFSVKDRKDFDFSGRAVSFATEEPFPGDQLVIIGFGSKSDNVRKFNPTISNDRDCIYFDQGRDLKVEKVSVRNAFSSGCDTSTGDSGSAIMHKKSGKIVAVLFGFTKSKTFQPSSVEIENLINTNSTDQLWAHSSLGISIDEVIYRLDL